jgi:hypothetical protein
MPLKPKIPGDCDKAFKKYSHGNLFLLRNYISVIKHQRIAVLESMKLLNGFNVIILV